MGGRTLAFASVLAAAFGAPYLINKMAGSAPTATDSATGGYFGSTAFSGSEQPGLGNSYNSPAMPGNTNIAGRPSSLGAGQVPGLDAMGQEHLGEIIRFDISSSWLASRWPTVSRVSAPTGLAGYRVPLVTGVSEDDISGALTYYFDNSGRVQRIHLVGLTGDPARIEALVTQQYKLEPSRSSFGTVYQSSWNGKLISALQVTPAAVMRTSDQLNRYKVEMELNRATDNYFLSSEYASRLQNTGVVTKETGTFSYFEEDYKNGFSGDRNQNERSEVITPPQLRY